MAKPKIESQLPLINTIAYTISRVAGGWVVVEFKIVESIVTSMLRITEPDVLSITEAKLSQIVRSV